MYIRIVPFCFVLFVVSTFAFAETYFEIIDEEENSVFGTIAALDQKQIVMDVQGTPLTIPLEKLVKIRNLASNPYEGIAAVAHLPNLGQQPRPAATAVRSARSKNEQNFTEYLAKIQKTNEQTVRKPFPGSVIALELKDGFQLTASSFTVVKSQGVCRPLELQNDLSIPLNNLSAVRFIVRSLSEVVSPPADWLRLAVPNSKGDHLIVGNPGAFDVYTGILNEVNAETVSFTVDGEVLPVPRRRVYGLVFHGETTGNAPATASPTSTPPLATLTLWSGTRGMISDLRLNENKLTWQTTGGVSMTVPLDHVSEIDFGEKGIAYLLDFERVKNEFTLPVAPDVKPEQLKLLQTFYESRTKMSREVVLDGTAYDRAITLQGKASLEYHLPKSFAVLKAVIGVEDQFRPQALASLQILADSQILGTWELRGDAASQPISLNLPQNCRLITIIAEPVPQSNIPAVLTIADPKLFE
jgi:hypothetical protein